MALIDFGSTHMALEFMRRSRRLFKCASCLIAGFVSQISFAEDYQYSQTGLAISQAQSNFHTTPHHKLHPMNLPQALWAILFDEGVKAFGVDSTFTNPGIGKGFIINREDTQLKLQYRF